MSEKDLELFKMDQGKNVGEPIGSARLFNEGT